MPYPNLIQTQTLKPSLNLQTAHWKSEDQTLSKTILSRPVYS